MSIHHHFDFDFETPATGPVDVGVYFAATVDVVNVEATLDAIDEVELWIESHEWRIFTWTELQAYSPTTAHEVAERLDAWIESERSLRLDLVDEACEQLADEFQATREDR